MPDLNTFNNGADVDDEYIGDAVTAIVCGLLGFFALGAAVAVAVALAAPWLVLVLCGAMLVGGTAVAIVSPRWRPVAGGLAFAGGLPTLYLYVVLSVGGVA